MSSGDASIAQSTATSKSPMNDGVKTACSLSALLTVRQPELGMKLKSFPGGNSPEKGFTEKDAAMSP